MRIRAATDDDLAGVTALWKEHGGPTRTSFDERTLRRLMAFDADALLVCDVDGVVAGTLVVGFDGWRSHLYRLAVAPAFRRRGIATRLIAAAIQRVRELGVERIDAMVDSTNQTGTAFWTTSGFELDAIERRWSLHCNTEEGAA